jgi:hypothetical protein
MSPQLLRAIAVERMNDIAREAEERRRARGVVVRERPVRRREHMTSARWPGLRAMIRRLQRA